MTVPAWIRIRYREFYDFPRTFVIEHEGEHYVFDCAFDDELEDYPKAYQVYRLTPRQAVQLDERSWASITAGAEHIAEVPTEQVLFDPTRREAVAESITRFLSG